MKSIFLSISLLAASFLCQGQEKVINDPNATVRDVKGFSAIEVSDGIDLFLTQSNDEAVAVSAIKDEYRDKIKTVVENGVLKIYYGNNNLPSLNFKLNRKLRAYVSFKALDRLKAMAGSDVKVTGTISGEKLKLNISSGSDFSGRVDVKDLEVNQASGSDIHISGRAENLDVQSTSGSDFHGFDLITETCRAQSNSGSDIYITVNKELSVKAGSGSDVHYRGNGSIKETNTWGGSSVRRAK